VPKTNLGALTHLEYKKSREILPPPPNEFLKTHPIRSKDFIRAPLAPLISIFNGHYPYPKSLSLIGIMPYSLS
jgi:hypothetical protein